MSSTDSTLPDDIKFYFTTIVMPIGFSTNAISTIIFFKKSLNKLTNMGMLYGWFTILNCIALMNLLVFNILDYNGVDYLDTVFTCKFLNVWNKIVIEFPSFQQSLIAFFLWIQISFPNKYKQAILKTYYFNLGIAVYILTTVSLNYSYYLDFDTSLNSTFLESNQNLSTVCTDNNNVDFMADIIHIINRAFLPCFLIFVFNALSLKHISKSRKRFKKLPEKSSNLVYCIIGMNLLFLMTYMPWTVAFIIHHVSNFINDDVNNTEGANFVNSLIFKMFFAICDCISYLNNMSPFFFNIVFNSIFRREFSLLLRINMGKISQSTSSTKMTINFINY